MTDYSMALQKRARLMEYLIDRKPSDEVVNMLKSCVSLDHGFNTILPTEIAGMLDKLERCPIREGSWPSRVEKTVKALDGLPNVLFKQLNIFAATTQGYRHGITDLHFAAAEKAFAETETFEDSSIEGPLDVHYNLSRDIYDLMRKYIDQEVVKRCGAIKEENERLVRKLGELRGVINDV